MAREERKGMLRDLICAVATVEEPRLPRLLDRATKMLRDFKGPRVNQFAVQDRLQGLIERAEISNGEELGRALSVRVDKANDLHHKLMPEYLTLLLELSDNPIEKTNLHDLGLIKETTTSQQLSWEDILRDDPLDNADGLWDNVDFAGSESSDEDKLSLISASTDDPRDVTSPSLHRNIQDTFDHYETIPVSRDIEALEALRSEGSEILHGREQTHSVSELQVVREIIFMLRGCDTDLFERSNNKIAPRPFIKGDHLSQDLLRKIMDQFSLLGERLDTLRARADVEAGFYVAQTYQYCLSQELRSFDRTLSELESRTISLEERPTLLEVLSEVQNSSKKILPLGEIAHFENTVVGSDIKILESLFNLACHQQGVGNIDAFNRTADVFDRCFHTYLQSTKDWIFRAEINQDGVSNFIEEYLGDQNKRQSRTSQFRIAYDGTKQLKAPEFLHPFVAVVFNTGKSLKFLQLLGKEPQNTKATDFQRAQYFATPSSSELTPFSEQFRVSFKQWLEPIHNQITSTLSDTLRKECGLQWTIASLHDVFLGQYGPSLDHLAEAVLSSYTTSPSRLTEAASLNAIYHEAFVSADRVNEDYISIRIQKVSTQLRNTIGIGSLLALQELSYKIPWTIASIVPSSTLESYRRIHVMLLHVRVAKRAIDKKFHQGMIKTGATRDKVGIQAVRLLHRLRWFVHTLQSYFLDTAVRDAIPAFLERMDDPGDLDHKISVYVAFTELVEKRLFLQESASTARQAITSILDLVVKAASFLQRQWDNLHPKKPTDLDGQLDNSALEDSTPSLADIEENLDRLRGLEATYTKFLGFVYTSAYETARLEGDKCMQMLVESITLGTSTRISVA